VEWVRGNNVRVGLVNAAVDSVVVKARSDGPDIRIIPRGWNTDIGHRRKVKSYAVETTWYEHLRQRAVGLACRGAWPLRSKDDEVLMVLEDLDAAGYPLRKRSARLGRNRLPVWPGWRNFTRVTWGKLPEGTLGSGNLLAPGDPTSGIGRLGGSKA
jgi:hypothetical protein